MFKSLFKSKKESLSTTMSEIANGELPKVPDDTLGYIEYLTDPVNGDYKSSIDYVGLSEQAKLGFIFGMYYLKRKLNEARTNIDERFKED